MGILHEQDVADRMIAFRRDLHQHPELSGKEERTAEKICEELARLGISYRRNVGGEGVLAEFPGPPEVPYLALRADMDALPIHEETGLPFASVYKGRMHACAHDGHTSILIGTAHLLAKRKALPAPVRLVFQPSEETATGARAMIHAGALDNVGLIFGGHLDRHYPTGKIIISSGIVNASTDSFRIELSGRGGHAARPHECVDAVVVGSLLVMAIQTIVSREINPAHPSVITVGKFEAGAAGNVIASRAILEGTIRAEESEVREHLKRSLGRITEAIGQLHDAHISLTIEEGTPPVHNTPFVADIARQAAAASATEDCIEEMQSANMGGEDFANYLEHVPGCYVRLGAQVPGRENFPAHSSRFDFDEAALLIGAKYYRSVVDVAGRWLRENTT